MCNMPFLMTIYPIRFSNLCQGEKPDFGNILHIFIADTHSRFGFWKEMDHEA